MVSSYLLICIPFHQSSPNKLEVGLKITIKINIYLLNNSAGNKTRKGNPLRSLGEKQYNQSNRSSSSWRAALQWTKLEERWVTPWVKLFPWTNFHEKHSVIYNLSTSKLKFTPPHRFSRSGHSTTVNNDRHQSTPPRPGYSMSFYRLSDQLTCNNISLMALQPKQREWHLAIFSRHIPSLHATKFGNDGPVQGRSWSSVFA